MFRKFLLARIREPSTWAGVVALVAAWFGRELSPTETHTIAAAIVAVIGAILVFIPEKRGPGASADLPRDGAVDHATGDHDRHVVHDDAPAADGLPRVPERDPGRAPGGVKDRWMHRRQK